MGFRYYNDLHIIDDDFRRTKYQTLLLNSLRNDFKKWEENISDSCTKYISPKYNNSVFQIECRYTGLIFAYVHHFSNLPIPNVQNELITDSLNQDLKNEIQKLRSNIFTHEIYEIEKAVGSDTKQQRKEKLELLEIETLKNQIEDTYIDWLSSKNEITAKMIAKIIFSYRRKQDLYDLWIEKFGEEELVMNEIKNK